MTMPVPVLFAWWTRMTERRFLLCSMSHPCMDCCQSPANLANLRLAQETESRAWISGAGALACAIALTALCWQVWKVPETRPHLWILVAMIALSLGLEVAYRAATKRQIHLGRGPGKK